jgi:hypothetical protein
VRRKNDNVEIEHSDDIVCLGFIQDPSVESSAMVFLGYLRGT